MEADLHSVVLFLLLFLFPFVGLLVLAWLFALE